MTNEESRRLQLAYRAWREAEPSEADLDRAVSRMQRTLVRPRATAHGPRIGSVFAVAVALIAVLAYAAPGSRARLSDLSKRVFGASGGEGAGVVTPPPPRAQSQPARPVSAPPVVEVPAPLAAPPEIPQAVPRAKQPATTWQDVNRALAAGDDASASRALKKLDRTAADPNTRAKARLGLAQLALGKGDCARARALAKSVATAPNLDDKIVHRAHTVLLACEIR